jgi:glyoxylase I family protein
MFKRIDHVEIVPADIEKCLDFYVDILNFKIKERIPLDMPPIKEVIFIELGDTVIEVISVKDPEPKSDAAFPVGWRGIAIEVEDMKKAVEYLKDKGVEITVEPVDIGVSIRGEIMDPDGFMVELRQWK